jgi:membrane protease YdiL (CAAX protease family)
LISKEVMDAFLGPYSGQVSLITTVILLTVYIRWRGQKWSSMGLKSLPGRRAKLMVIPQAMMLFGAVLVIIISLTKGLDAIGLTFLSETSESELARFGDISGNLRMYLTLIALSWIGAGFGEEMFFRGFLLTRLQTVFQGFRFAPILAVVLGALLFGGVHFYAQGLAGFVNAGVIGLIFGTFFVRSKNNLWPLIVVHGFINSLGFTLDFLGLAG